jgi:release factor glutamine methyltransferase
MTIHEAQQQLLVELYQLYDRGEASAIADLIMENITKWKKIDRLVKKTIPLTGVQAELFKKYSEELAAGKPVQYVLHESWFCNMKFYVDENVLIPRPETEELVEWIVKELSIEKLSVERGEQKKRNKINRTPFRILDIGTGSGCIPISLKKKLENIEIYSCDVNEMALNVAKQNALSNDAQVNFLHLDFLEGNQRNELPSFNIIVSNPPYIKASEKSTMAANVVNFEPHIALFVKDDDPLIFYNVISDFALKKLLPGGTVYVEIHEDLYSNVKELFPAKNFSEVTIKKDLLGKNRMLKATLLP